MKQPGDSVERNKMALKASEKKKEKQKDSLGCNQPPNVPEQNKTKRKQTKVAAFYIKNRYLYKSRWLKKYVKRREGIRIEK